MKAAVVGCGSIGQRHIRNLLGIADVDSITVCTARKDCESLWSGCAKEIRAVRDCSGIDADFAVVCNETSKHLEVGLELASRGMDLLIEKPLCADRSQALAFRESLSGKKNRVMVAYNFRFLGAIRMLKTLLEGHKLGRLFFARIEAGQYLPDWRPGRDYRRVYSSRISGGGGVALDLSHEIDYMCYLFGMPDHWSAVRSKVSDLEIETDDLFEGVYRFKGGFLCAVHLDYLMPKKTRRITITGSAGSADCDLVAGKLVLSGPRGQEVIDDPTLFDLERSYRDELLWFLDRQKPTYPAAGIEDAIGVLRCLEANNV